MADPSPLLSATGTAAESNEQKEMVVEGAPAELLHRAEALAERLAERAAEIDREGAFPTQAFAEIEAAGLLAAPLPPAHGGLGWGTEPGGTKNLLRLLGHLGRGNLSVGRLYEGHVNALALLFRFGTPEQQARFAADARAGNIFAVWNTEGEDGVQLRPDGPGRWRLEGSKTFASGAGHLQRPLITAARPGSEDADSRQMVIVPADEAPTEVDESAWTPLGMRASASFKIDFTGATVEDEHLIGEPGDYHREPWFSGGAIRFAAVQLGGAEALLSVTREHLRRADRTDHPHQRARAAEMAAALESARLLLERSAEIADAFEADFASGEEGGDERATRKERAEAVVAHANLARTAVERACLDVLERAERSVGARGMARPHPLERLVRDLRLYLRQPAPDAARDDAGRFVLETDRPAHRLWQEERSEEPLPATQPVSE